MFFHPKKTREKNNKQLFSDFLFVSSSKILRFPIDRGKKFWAAAANYSDFLFKIYKNLGKHR